MALVSFIAKLLELLLGLIIKTPAEKRQGVVRSIDAAIKKGNETGGNTSEEEDIING